jgi:hypothetical protein
MARRVMFEPFMTIFSLMRLLLIAFAALHESESGPLRQILRRKRMSALRGTVRRQRSLDRTGGLKKGEFLAHRNVHRSEDETANSIIKGIG